MSRATYRARTRIANVICGIVLAVNITLVLGLLVMIIRWGF